MDTRRQRCESLVPSPGMPAASARSPSAALRLGKAPPLGKLEGCDAFGNKRDSCLINTWETGSLGVQGLC